MLIYKCKRDIVFVRIVYYCIFVKLRIVAGLGVGFCPFVF